MEQKEREDKRAQEGGKGGGRRKEKKRQRRNTSTVELGSRAHAETPRPRDVVGLACTPPCSTPLFTLPLCIPTPPELTDSVETVPTDDALPRSHRLKKNDPTIIRANALARPTYMQNKMKNF